MRTEVSALRKKLDGIDIPEMCAKLEDARKALRGRRLKAWKDWVRGGLGMGKTY